MKNIKKISLLHRIIAPFFSPQNMSEEKYQSRILHNWLVDNVSTYWWKKYNFKDIRSIKDFQHSVPLNTYDTIQPYIETMLQWSKDILWTWRIPFFSKSSWTTATSKYIPITKLALKNNHYAVWKDGLAYYMKSRPDSDLMWGQGVIMWGRLVPNPADPEVMNVWDVSAILQHNAPLYTKLFRKPSKGISFMENFDEKLDAMIDETKDLNITFIAGVPSWITLFLQRLVERTGKKNVLEVRPNLELFLRWWINIAPYKNQLSQLLPGDQVWYRQNYNASEWFFAVQDKPHADDMLLATHHNIFYEFIPFDQIDSLDPTICLLHELEIGKRYEMIITTDGWLRRYRIWDVIEVTAIDPIRIRVAGRTKSYLNAFGEELMVHTTDSAIKYACEMCQLPLAEYVATPIVLDHGWYHQRYIDFGRNVDKDVVSLMQWEWDHVFVDALEHYLQQHNSDYQAKRKGDLLMKKLQVVFLTPWTFHEYLSSKWKLWGQHKIKRLWNESRDLMKEMGEFLKE